MSDLIDHLDEAVRKVMREENVTNYAIINEGNAEKGEGYFSMISFVAVKSERDYNFVIKTSKKNEELRKQAPVEMSFRNEVYFFRTILPTFRDFQIERRTKPIDLFPKMYLASEESNKEVVVLGNLKTTGYEMWDRKKPMTREHAVLILKNYGKFHAVSMALKDQKPEEFEELTKDMKNITWEISKNLVTFHSQNCSNAYVLLEQNGRKDLAEKFSKKFHPHVGDYVRSEGDESDPVVAIHGDGWINNFMFYSENGDQTKPTQMKFLDFQMTRIASPAVDLSYFFYSCFDKEIFDQFDQLLRVYYDSFSGFARQLGSDPEKLMTFDGLRNQWRKFATFGVVMATAVIRVEICSSEEAPDLEELAEKDDDIRGVLNFSIGNEEAYNRRVVDVFVHYGDNFL